MRLFVRKGVFRLLFNHFSQPRFNATDGGDAGAPSPTPPPAPAPSSAPTDDAVKAKLAEFENAKKELEAAQKKLADYAKKEQEELDKQKSVEQKLAEKEAELAKAKRDALVAKVAASKGLDPDLFDRVRGEDENTIIADIELLLGKFSAPNAAGETAKGGRTLAGKDTAKTEDTTPSGKAQEEIQQFNAWRAELLKK